LVQLAGVEQFAFELGQCLDDGFEGFLFAPQCLRVFGVIPDIGVFELGIDDQQALGLGIVVKDTSVRPPGARGSLRCGG